LNLDGLVVVTFALSSIIYQNPLMNLLHVPSWKRKEKNYVIKYSRQCSKNSL